VSYAVVDSDVVEWRQVILEPLRRGMDAMSNRYRLVGVRNAELVAGLVQLVQRGNQLTAEAEGSFQIGRSRRSTTARSTLRMHSVYAKRCRSFDATPRRRFATGQLIGGACAYDLVRPRKHGKLL